MYNFRAFEFEVYITHKFLFLSQELGFCTDLFQSSVTVYNVTKIRSVSSSLNGILNYLV